MLRYIIHNCITNQPRCQSFIDGGEGKPLGEGGISLREGEDWENEEGKIKVGNEADMMEISGE